nr:MAG TPA: holin [Caudoviricetes sp.]
MRSKHMLFENDTTVMETGTRAIGIVAFGSELAGILTDARWMLLAITVCVLADFRYGWGESSKRYKRAKEKGDKIVMAQYKWRTSRAVRRTVNKLIDYIVWVTIGMTLGFAVLQPLGVDYMLGGVIATAVAIACEAKSFCGHFFYLHGIKIEEKSVKGFLKAFVVAFAKRKNADMGEALEDAFEDNNKTKEK